MYCSARARRDSASSVVYILDGGSSGWGNYFFAGSVDLGRVFRVSVFVVLGGGDAGGGCQFCG